MLAQRRNPTATVIDIQTARKGRALMSGATEAVQREEQVNRQEESAAKEAVNGWVQRVMLGAVSILVTLFLGFIFWLAPAVSSLMTSMQTQQNEQTYLRAELGKMSAAQDKTNDTINDLALKSMTWATKDQLIMTKDQLLAQIAKAEDQLNDLRMRVLALEAAQPKTTRR